MSFRFIPVLLLLITSTSVFSQTENCACCSEKYNQFDFWLGEWNVFNPDGRLVGTNTISKEYDNCMLQEKWKSTSQNRGASTSFYNKENDTWNQVWVDNSGFVLKLKGQLLNGNMVLKSDLKEGTKSKYYNQISWTKNEDGSITQLWEIFNEENVKISEVFHGIYKKTLN